MFVTFEGSRMAGLNSTGSLDGWTPQSILSSVCFECEFGSPFTWGIKIILIEKNSRSGIIIHGTDRIWTPLPYKIDLAHSSLTTNDPSILHNHLHLLQVHKMAGGGAPGANSRGRGGKFKKYTRGGMSPV